MAKTEVKDEVQEVFRSDALEQANVEFSSPKSQPHVIRRRDFNQFQGGRLLKAALVGAELSSEEQLEDEDASNHSQQLVIMATPGTDEDEDEETSDRCRELLGTAQLAPPAPAEASGKTDIADQKRGHSKEEDSEGSQDHSKEDSEGGSRQQGMQKEARLDQNETWAAVCCGLEEWQEGLHLAHSWQVARAVGADHRN